MTPITTLVIVSSRFMVLESNRSSALLLGKLTPKGLSRLWGFVSVLKGRSGAEERDNTAERMQVSASRPQEFANCPALHQGLHHPTLQTARRNSLYRCHPLCQIRSKVD